MLEPLIEQLKRHEGLRLKPYRCSAGKLTIGYGRNLEDRGINETEAEFMLRADAEESWEWAATEFPELDEVRLAVIANMHFNLGPTRLRLFHNMYKALRNGAYTMAAEEMLDSLWARQVGKRAKELAAQMKTGAWG